MTHDEIRDFFRGYCTAHKPNEFVGLPKAVCIGPGRHVPDVATYAVACLLHLESESKRLVHLAEEDLLQLIEILKQPAR